MSFVKNDEADVIGAVRAPLAAVPAEPSLFDQPSEARAAREEGIAQADEHADEIWREVALAAVVTCARRLPTFTADDILDVMEGTSATTHQPSALGPVMIRAGKIGLIVKTGRQVPTRLKRRHRDLTEWQSLILDVAVPTRAHSAPASPFTTAPDTAP